MWEIIGFKIIIIVIVLSFLRCLYKLFNVNLVIRFIFSTGCVQIFLILIFIIGLFSSSI